MTMGVSAFPPSTVHSHILIPSRTQSSHSLGPPGSSSSSVVFSRLSRDNRRLCSSDLRLKPSKLARLPPKISSRCNGSTRPGGPGPGESDGRTVLDAFFLGKALAEALNERIESTVGEFLSVLGRLQAEQQKQVQGFQEEVLERAERAKERAAREAMEAQGFAPKSSTSNVSAVNDDNTVNVPSATVSMTTSKPPTSSNLGTPKFETDPDANDKDPLLGGVTNED